MALRERPPAGETSNTAKYSAAEAAVGAADHVIQASRRRRLTDEYGLMPYWALVLLLCICAQQSGDEPQLRCATTLGVAAVVQTYQTYPQQEVQISPTGDDSRDQSRLHGSSRPRR